MPGDKKPDTVKPVETVAPKPAEQQKPATTSPQNKPAAPDRDQGPTLVQDLSFKGGFYSGDVKGNVPHGQGTFTNSNCIYTGEFFEGTIMGQGTVEDFLTGTSYTGAFASGQPNGQGKYKFGDGSEYEGTVVEGRFEGDGQFTFPNKAMYFGGFKNHQRSGEGTMLDDTHNEIYQGQWSNDRPANKTVAALCMRLPETYVTLN